MLKTNHVTAKMNGVVVTDLRYRTKEEGTLLLACLLLRLDPFQQSLHIASCGRKVGL